MDTTSATDPFGLNRTLLFVVNVDWFFCSHRLPLAIAARQAGFAVHVACCASDPASIQAIRSAGCVLHHVPFSRGAFNPFRETKVLLALSRVYRNVRPDLVHHVTIKPVLFGSLLARLFRIPATVNAITGMGHVYSATGAGAAIRRSIVSFLYKKLLSAQNSRLILQNPDDLDAFVGRGIIPKSAATLIRGSGVDLTQFRPGSAEEKEVPVVILPARMLWAKGVAEFVDAARLVHEAGIRSEFLLAGSLDPENPGHVAEHVLREFSQKGHVRWIGHVSDMAFLLRSAAIVCLPSFYAEGIPKSLIEAAACGLPIVTTDTAGCREIVRDGWNGLLVPAHDAKALAVALQRLLLDPVLRAEFGRNARQYAEREFGIQGVIDRTLAVYRELLRV